MDQFEEYHFRHLQSEGLYDEANEYADECEKAHRETIAPQQP